MEVFVLASGEYAHGLAALLNSLEAAGFGGRVLVGYQPPLPIELSQNAPVELIQLRSDRWMGNLKAEFILGHAQGRFVFIDADCILTGAALLDLIDSAIARAPLFCAEGLIGERDVRRHGWLEGYRNLDPKAPPATSAVYYNSGFLAGDVTRDAAWLRDWNVLTERLRGAGGFFEDPAFPMPDQDCLNAILQSPAFAFGSIGPPDVWLAASAVNPFMPIGHQKDPMLLHCTGEEKPWRYRRPPQRAPHLYDLAWRHFTSVHTPWARTPLELTPSVAAWMRQDWTARAARLVRKLRP